MIGSSPVLLRPVVQLPEVDLARGTDYLPLPAIVGRSTERVITCRMHLSWRERLTLLVHGNIWLQQLTFNRSYPPCKLTVTEPEISDCL